MVRGAWRTTIQSVTKELDVTEHVSYLQATFFTIWGILYVPQGKVAHYLQRQILISLD